jgi:AraC family transcriptional regulator, regulatory protein of adaptative response / DNA-3-methyladenine glycosylase II
VSTGAGGALTLRLDYREPFDADALLAFFAKRAVPGVEEVADGDYRRSLRLPHGAGVAQLHPAAGHVRAELWLEDERDADAAVALCRALLDLDTDPLPIAQRLESDPLIGPLVRRSRGRRVPGSVDGAELAVRAVLGQQVSLAGAATLAARLVADHGEALARPLGAVTHLFPSAAALACADPDRLAMPGSRRRALLGLTAALASGEVVLEPGAESALLALPGIGPWTVAYISMRVLRDPDAFMPTDLGVRHALERLGEDGSPAGATRIAERWRPYRAYALQHLWAALAG